MGRRQITHEANPAPLGGPRLEILLVDYEAARDDERSLQSTQAALFGAAVAVIAFVAAAAAQTCRYPASSSDSPRCVSVPEPILGALPLAPLSLLAFLVVIGAVSTVRSYYLRALERELRSYAGEPMSSIPSNSADRQIYPASYFQILTEMTSLRRGHVIYRMMNGLLLATILFIFGGLVYFIADRVSGTTQLAMVVGYSTVLCLLATQTVMGTIGGRSLFRRVLGTFADRSSDAEIPAVPAPPPHQRSLNSYLLLPRPADAIKWTFVPATFAIGVWASGETSSLEVLRAFFTAFILEYLVYEARYQLNDVRDFASDEVHPGRVARRRLPSGESKQDARRIVHISLLVGLARLAVAVVLAVLLDTTLGLGVTAPVVILIGLVFGTGLVYETLRSLTTRESWGLTTPVWSVPAVWTWVGVGYAIRGITGLWLAGFALDDWSVIVSLPLLVAFGVLFVTATWALDATSHCRGDSTPGSDVETVVYGPALSQKRHLVDLLSFVKMEAHLIGDDPDPDCDDLACLRSRGSFFAPWNVGLFVAGPLSMVVGLLLVNQRLDSLQVLVGAASALFAALILARCDGTLRRTMVTVLWMAVVTIEALTLHAKPFAVAGTLCLLVFGTYIFFREQSYRTLTAGLDPMKLALRRMMRSLSRLVIGKRTAEMLSSESWR